MTMRKVLVILIIIFLISCKKKPYLSRADLIGTWVDTTTVDIELQLLFKQNTMIKTLISHSGNVYLDTFLYDLNDKGNLLYLTPTNSPMTTSTHKIAMNKNKTCLVIWGLFAGPSTSQNVLKKK